MAAPAPLVALVDPLRIEQVITNLLDNAVKFAPKGSPIEVEVARAGPQAVQVVVRDHGPGIPAEECAQIFDRFYQAHSEWHGGMGLGLFISRQIVDLHGGSISVECPADGGARFIVLLPVGTDEPGVRGG